MNKYDLILEHVLLQVSCSYRQENDDMEGLGVYNYIHCEPVNSHVQSDYDHVPQHGVGDDYSHMNSCNANQVFSSGEYGVISWQKRSDTSFDLFFIII